MENVFAVTSTLLQKREREEKKVCQLSTNACEFAWPVELLSVNPGGSYNVSGLCVETLIYKHTNTSHETIGDNREYFEVLR